MTAEIKTQTSLAHLLPDAYYSYSRENIEQLLHTPTIRRHINNYQFRIKEKIGRAHV